MLRELNGTFDRANAGFSVAMLGDLDGDGYSEVAVGQPAINSSTLIGGVAVFNGATGALRFTKDFNLSPDHLGFSVSSLGDWNLDGCPDLVVGSRAAYVSVLSGVDGDELDRFAPHDTYDVAGVGDMNLDGWPDLVVSDPNDSSGRGIVSFFSGRTGANLFTLTGENPGDFFGFSVAGAGDCNDDGYPDLVVGAQGWPSGQSVGRAYVFAGPNGTPLFHHDGLVSPSQHGYAVSRAGDLNADGHDDVLVGAPHHVPKGRAVALSGVDGSVLFQWLGDPLLAGFIGGAVAPAGDVDLDGHADVAVGSDYGDTVEVFSGRDGSRLRVITGTLSDYFGYSLDGGLDADGDGHFDLLVGAPGLQYGRGYAQLHSIAHLPVVNSVSPDRGRYTGGTVVTIHGEKFARAQPPTVAFGGVPATTVQLVNDATIIATMPPLPPGLAADVTVHTDIGAGVLAHGFRSTPFMLEPSGDLWPDGFVVNTYLCEPGDTIYAIYGIDPGFLPIPPFDGAFGINPFFEHFIQPAWPFGVHIHDDNLPDDPALSGVTILCQALIGPKLAGKNRDGATTNVVSFVIQ